MKKLLSLIILLALPALPAFAQNVTPTAEPNQGVHFEFGTDYARFTSGTNATVVWARLPVSDRYSFVYSQYQIPDAKAQIYLGEVEFREKLSHLFKSKGSPQVNLDAIQVFVRGGLGSKRDDLGNNPLVAYGVHGGANLQVGTVAGAALLLQLEVGYIGIPSEKLGPKRFISTASPEIKPGFAIHF